MRGDRIVAAAMKKAVLDIELCRRWETVAVPEGYHSAHALLRWQSHPVGRVDLDVTDNHITASRLWMAAWRAVGGRLQHAALQQLLG
ncbi:MAG: hypothetical protein ACRD1H_17265, partial [Vicinamibacterales bacterium]